jgi:hypothetical protein
MCRGCHDVGAAFSAIIGTASSTAAPRTNAHTGHPMSRITAHTTMHNEMPIAYRSAVARRGGSWRAARNHRETKPMRITT